MKTISYRTFFVALVLLCVSAVKSYCRKLSSGCCGSGGNRVKVKRVADRNKSHYPYTVTLAVDGIVCQNCANTVSNALNTLDGVWASVELGSKTAVVRMKYLIPRETLRQTMTSGGPYTLLRIEEETE